METFLTIVHILVAIVLILVVLLQQGKGAGMGAAFGGGSSGSVLGTSGGSVFAKVTAAAAVFFMLTSLSLAYVSGRGGTSLMQGAPVPAEEEAAPQPEQTPATGTTAPAAPAEATGEAQ